MTRKRQFARLVTNVLSRIVVISVSWVFWTSRAEAFASYSVLSSNRVRATFVPHYVLSREVKIRASPTDAKDGLDGASDFELFAPKLLDGIGFNLFGIGRKDDEDVVTGAFQPPRDSMTGFVVVITGTSSGLGLESAKRLALAGATVIVTARTPTKTSQAVQEVRNYCLGGPDPSSHGTGSFVHRTPIVHGIPLDLADFSSIRRFPERYRKSMLSLSKISNRDPLTGKILGHPKTITQKIHVLLNNACGGSLAEKETTVDGFERIFQSGYLGHFVLTASLFQEGVLNDDATTSGCTIINVSSSAHRSSVIYTDDESVECSGPIYGFDFDNINSELSFSMNTYSRTKLANIMFTKELQKRANNSNMGTWLRAVSVDPGVSATNIWSNAIPSDATWKDKLLVNGLTKLMTKVERAANAHVWLAYMSTRDPCSTSNCTEWNGGEHFDERCRPAPSSIFANQQESNQKLWELSEELGGIRFDLGTTNIANAPNPNDEEDTVK